MPVGMPHQLLLKEFGNHIYNAFGYVAYHVGSSLHNKTGWRDVDVRLILPDEEYNRLELGSPSAPHANARWVSLVRAWSSFGKDLIGLPIDFQIQRATEANMEYKDSRSALILTYHRKSEIQG